jgi:hypothetical protein
LALEDYFRHALILRSFVSICVEIKEIQYSNLCQHVSLTREDMMSLASMECLEFLRLDCVIFTDFTPIRAIEALNEFESLKSLCFYAEKLDLFNVLPVIGRGLITLEFAPSTLMLRTVDMIVDTCPNLQYLDIVWDDYDAEEVAVAIDSLKDGLKRLAKLNLNGRNVVLGTEWRGYDCEESEDEETDDEIVRVEEQPVDESVSMIEDEV